MAVEGVLVAVALGYKNFAVKPNYFLPSQFSILSLESFDK